MQAMHAQREHRQPHIYAQAVCINLLSQSEQSPSDAENFDVFTAGVINHKSPSKCLLVPELFFFFFLTKQRRVGATTLRRQ